MIYPISQLLAATAALQQLAAALRQAGTSGLAGAGVRRLTFAQCNDFIGLPRSASSNASSPPTIRSTPSTACR